MTASPSPVVAVPRRRRRWRAFVWLAVLLVLVGRGVGWFGSGPAAGPAASPAADVPAAPAGEGARVAPPAPPAAAAPTVPAAAAPQAVAEPAPSPVPEPPPQPAVAVADAAPAIDSDRFASFLALLQARLHEGRCGSAMLVLDHLRSLPLDAPQRTALAGRAADVEAELAAAGARVLQLLQRGEVLAAKAAVLAMLAEGAHLVEPLLVQALAPFGVAGDVRAAAVRGATPWPVPIALPRERQVRFVAEGRQATGAIVDSRTDRVTLRVDTAGGVTFPTVPMVACEPVAVTAAEAIELGFAALQARDPVLARLWLVAAVQRGAPNDGRRQRLAALLE
jgi:hypothetical protein